MPPWPPRPATPPGKIARSQTLAEMVEGAKLQVSGSLLQPSTSNLKPVRVHAAARIDFGGGWTDTPPYSIERGGTVLNAAVTLRGRYPILAEAQGLAEPGLVLDSRDIEATLVPATVGDVLAYANPADPFALLKAALVLRGVVPQDEDPARPLADLFRELGCGLRISTQTFIPADRAWARHRSWRARCWRPWRAGRASSFHRLSCSKRCCASNRC